MADQRHRRPAGLGETLFGMAQDAVRDIRSKLIDEAWFGRHSPEQSGAHPGSVTKGDPLGRTLPPSDIPVQNDSWRELTHTALDLLPDEAFDRRPSFEESWTVRAPEKTRDGPEPGGGHDLDR